MQFQQTVVMRMHINMHALNTHAYEHACSPNDDSKNQPKQLFSSILMPQNLSITNT